MGIEIFGSSMLADEIDKFQPLLARYGLGALFFANLPAGCGIPLPGWPLLIVCAALASKGQQDITAVLVTAWIATQGGNMIGYLIGRFGVHRLLGRVSQESSHSSRIVAFLDRYGAAFLVVVPFVEGLRETGSLAAGALRMSWQRFLLGTILGTTLWVGVWGLGTYCLGEGLHHGWAWIKDLRPYTWGATVTVLVAVLGYLLWGRCKRGTA